MMFLTKSCLAMVKVKTRLPLLVPMEQENHPFCGRLKSIFQVHQNSMLNQANEIQKLKLTSS